MALLDDIKGLFHSGHSVGWIPLPEVDAYVYKSVSQFGVAIEFNSDDIISESFANCRLFTMKEYFQDDDTEYTFLKLECGKAALMDQFASVCCQFLELGTDNSTRINLLENPLHWWNNWCSLMGDSISHPTPYSVIAEMSVYEYLLQQGKNVTWTAAIWGSKDFETEDESFEVKSTIVRENTEATISSINQLDEAKKLFLFYYRMECSPKGKSINDMVRILVNDYNLSEDELEDQLAAVGYEKGRSKRTEKYIFRDKWLFEVDDNFPKITKNSFKGDDYPKGVKDIQYTIVINDIPHTTLE